MTSTRTLAVTIGIGEPYREYAEEAARWVRNHLDLATFIVTDEHLQWALDESSRKRRVWSIKFSLFEIIPAHWERIMYFDADWRPVRDWDVDTLFPDFEQIHVAPDRNHLAVVKSLERAYGLAPGNYFNSGWMLIPRSKSHRLQACKDQYEELPRKFGDQCVLNQVLADEVTHVSSIFNVCTPREWPDPATAMGVHSVNSDWNYQIYRGEIEDRIWNPPDHDDPVETIVRGLDCSGSRTPSVDHLLEIHQVGAHYRGGRGLDLGGDHGQSMLALGLAGIAVTGFSPDVGSHHHRVGVADRYRTRRDISRRRYSRGTGATGNVRRGAARWASRSIRAMGNDPPSLAKQAQTGRRDDR